MSFLDSFSLDRLFSPFSHLYTQPEVIGFLQHITRQITNFRSLDKHNLIQLSYILFPVIIVASPYTRNMESYTITFHFKDEHVSTINWQLQLSVCPPLATSLPLFRLLSPIPLVPSTLCILLLSFLSRIRQILESYDILFKIGISLSGVILVSYKRYEMSKI